MINEIKNKIEALLFASAKKLDVESISSILSIKKQDVINALTEMEKEINNRPSSVILINEGNLWGLNVKEKYSDVVSKIVSETELDKALMETLAVITWKYPVTQAEIIRLRHNKAYDHIKQLEEKGFIMKEKKGRSFQIKLTPKFFTYFDLPGKHAKETLKELFPNQSDEIEKSEQEIDIMEEQKVKAAEETENKKIQIQKQIADEKENEKNLKKELENLDSEFNLLEKG